ncbi:MAG: hypothetical protein OEL19_01340 [Sulfurimonas sp.]|nr:hypothetical protein [Sulfurimonas sp.]
MFVLVPPEPAIDQFSLLPARIGAKVEKSALDMLAFAVPADLPNLTPPLTSSF